MSGGAFREARRDGDCCFLGTIEREEEGGGSKNENPIPSWRQRKEGGLSPLGGRGKKVGACCIQGGIFFLRKSKKKLTVKGEATNENT